MGKRIAMAVAAFVAVCAMGAIVFSALGAVWGSVDAGLNVLFTFMLASFAFVATLVFQDKTP